VNAFAADAFPPTRTQADAEEHQTPSSGWAKYEDAYVCPLGPEYGVHDAPEFDVDAPTSGPVLAAGPMARQSDASPQETCWSDAVDAGKLADSTAKLLPESVDTANAPGAVRLLMPLGFGPMAAQVVLPGPHEMPKSSVNEPPEAKMRVQCAPPSVLR
jgi:hypothetical protein